MAIGQEHKRPAAFETHHVIPLDGRFGPIDWSAAALLALMQVLQRLKNPIDAVSHRLGTEPHRLGLRRYKCRTNLYQTFTQRTIPYPRARLLGSPHLNMTLWQS